MRVLVTLAFLSVSVLYSQTEHKDKVTDYPVHAMAGNVGIGADYLVHSIPAGDQTLFAQDYLVVEVAVFPAFAQPVTVTGNTFTLRLNRAKFPLASISPGFVAASLKYPDWEPHPHAEATAGMGNGGVILGRPAGVGRFPGDPNEDRRLPRVPDVGQQQGVGRTAPQSAEEVINRTAFAEGEIDHPMSGFIYFPFKGKMKSLKSVELIYQDRNTSIILKLL